MTDQAIQELRPMIGIKAACAVVGRSRATFRRELKLKPCHSLCCRSNSPGAANAF